MKHRLTPGGAIALVALFIALGGSALAAKHYVITSTKQIKPSVLKKLKGNQGPRGPQGAQGPPGPSGSSTTSGPDFRFAAVAADGTLQRGVGVVSVFGNAPGATRYVQFNRDVSQCYRSASLASGLGEIYSAIGASGDTVRVTADAFRDFQLIVECP
jgi:hypothetical protein